jgi:recombination protein RecA
MARAHLEALLRARKLDVTLTSGTSPAADAQVAPTGWSLLDAPLGGGLRRGHLSELVGARSAGRSAVFCRMAAAATGRGEAVALVDTHDRFDPATAAAAGLDLSRLLWVRDTGNAERALTAAMLVLQAGGFGLVAFDLADVHGTVLRGFPHTTWLRLARAIEGSPTAALLLGSEHIARSAGGCTIALDSPRVVPAGEWHGTTPRARRLRGLALHPRVISPRTGAVVR